MGVQFCSWSNPNICSGGSGGTTNLGALNGGIAPSGQTYDFGTNGNIVHGITFQVDTAGAAPTSSPANPQDGDFVHDSHAWGDARTNCGYWRYNKGTGQWAYLPCVQSGTGNPAGVAPCYKAGDGYRQTGVGINSQNQTMSWISTTAGAAGTCVWQRVNGALLYAEQYSSGSTTGGIQEALNACPYQGSPARFNGCTVMLPYGVTTLTSQILVGSCFDATKTATGINIIGYGSGISAKGDSDALAGSHLFYSGSALPAGSGVMDICSVQDGFFGHFSIRADTSSSPTLADYGILLHSNSAVGWATIRNGFDDIYVSHAKTTLVELNDTVVVQTGTPVSTSTNVAMVSVTHVLVNAFICPGATCGSNPFPANTTVTGVNTAGCIAAVGSPCITVSAAATASPGAEALQFGSGNDQMDTNDFERMKLECFDITPTAFEVSNSNTQDLNFNRGWIDHCDTYGLHMIKGSVNFHQNIINSQSTATGTPVQIKLDDNANLFQVNIYENTIEWWFGSAIDASGSGTRRNGSTVIRDNILAGTNGNDLSCGAGCSHPALTFQQGSILTFAGNQVGVFCSSCGNLTQPIAIQPNAGVGTVRLSWEGNTPPVGGNSQVPVTIDRTKAITDSLNNAPVGAASGTSGTTACTTAHFVGCYTAIDLTNAATVTCATTTNARLAFCQ